MKILEFENFSKKYPYETFELFTAVNFSVNENETIGIVCERQCGKSTIAKTIAGLVSQTAGKVLYHEKPLAETDFSQRRIAVIFEDFALMKGKTVLQNIAYPLKVRKVDKTVATSLVKTAVGKFGLESVEKTKVKKLDNIDKFKTALARASTREFDLVVFDDICKSVSKAVSERLVSTLTEDRNCAKVFTSSCVEDLSHCSKVFVICDYATIFVGNYEDATQYIESTSCFKKFENGEN